MGYGRREARATYQGASLTSASHHLSPFEAAIPDAGTGRSAIANVADMPLHADSGRMIRNIAAAMLLAASLGGCSYSYDLIASVRNGQIVIDVDPTSSHHPACLRRIEISAEDEREAAWLESVSYDDACANKFPLPYGYLLRGKHQPDNREVAAKPLRRETIYEVTATTGATGYGNGRFIVHADGRVENLTPKLLPSETRNGS